MIVAIAEVTACHWCKHCRQNGGVYRSLHAKQRGRNPVYKASWTSTYGSLTPGHTIDLFFQINMTSNINASPEGKPFKDKYQGPCLICSGWGQGGEAGLRKTPWVKKTSEHAFQKLAFSSRSILKWRLTYETKKKSGDLRPGAPRTTYCNCDYYY